MPRALTLEVPYDPWQHVYRPVPARSIPKLYTDSNNLLLTSGVGRFMLAAVKRNCSVDWVAHLDEVGVPIRAEARSIANELAAIKARYASDMRDLRQRVSELEAQVRRSWSSAEIEGAKQRCAALKDVQDHKSERKP